jgi:hypothetical protein
MDEELITFVIDGGDARNGNVSASVFASKLTAFLAAMYGLERAFSHSTQRQIYLEVVGLSRNSPNQVAMRPRSRVNGYDAGAAVRWSVDQLDRIRRGEAADRRIPESVLAQVVNLADYRTDKAAEIGAMSVVAGGHVVPLDGVLAGNAMAARASAVERAAAPWAAGVSEGSVFGELRGVVDMDGERQFYIAPPTGPSQIQCVFPEALREEMVANLFQVVRVVGMLHYNGRSAFPHLVDALGIEGRPPPNVHLLDLAGAFPELEYEPFVAEIA